MKQDVAAAVIQMVSSDRVEENLSAAGALVAEAAARQASLVVLPENFAYFGKDYCQIAEVFGRGRIQQQLASWAMTHGLWIVAGSLPLSTRPDGSSVTGNRVRTSSLVFAPGGQCVARYDKLHLFDVNIGDAQGSYRESAVFEAGDDVTTVDLGIATVGLSICYDVRFPELYRCLVAAGAEILTVPAAFTALTGRAHWHTLLKSRAIENTAFVLAANQGGQHGPKRQTFGHSLILDPWGEVLAEIPSGEGVAVATLEAARLAEVRSQMPSLAHRRLPNPMPGIEARPLTDHGITDEPD